MRIAFMRISPAWVGDQFGEKYTDLILLDAWAEQTPILGKGGVDAPSRNIPVPLKGADGVVRSNSKTISLERTTPSAPVKVASRYFLNGRSHPSFPKEGNSFQNPQLRQQSNAYTFQG